MFQFLQIQACLKVEGDYF